MADKKKPGRPKKNPDAADKPRKQWQYNTEFPAEETLPVPGEDHHIPHTFANTGKVSLRLPEQITKRVVRQCVRQAKTVSVYIREAILLKLAMDEQRENMPVMPPPGWAGY